MDSSLGNIPKPPPAPTFLRLAAGTIYFFFGFLKFFPDLSPAELLAGQSIMKITGRMVEADTALFCLAIFECFIGLCFLFNFLLPYLLVFFLAHQVSTFLPLFLFPELTFKVAPFAPKLEGQYIFKNLISLAAGWTVMFPAFKANVQHKRMARRLAREQVALAISQAAATTTTSTTSVVPARHGAKHDPARHAEHDHQIIPEHAPELAPEAPAVPALVSTNGHLPPRQANA